MAISRRGFVWSSLAGAGVAATGAAWWTGYGFRTEYDLRRFVLEQFAQLPDDELESFALEYQALHTGEAHTDALLRVLLGDAKPVPASLSDWRERYRRRIQQDFESDETVLLKKWVLSRTEGTMLCLCWRLKKPSSA